MIKEVHGSYSNQVFSKKVRGQKHLWEVNKCRKSSPHIGHFILYKYKQHPVQDNRCRKRQATIGHPFPHQLNIWIQINTSGSLHQSDSGCKSYINAQFVSVSKPIQRSSWWNTLPLLPIQQIWNWGRQKFFHNTQPWSPQSYPRQATGLIFIHKPKAATKWPCACCNCTSSYQQRGCYSAWNICTLSPSLDTCNHTNYFNWLEKEIKVLICVNNSIQPDRPKYSTFNY